MDTAAAGPLQHQHHRHSTDYSRHSTACSIPPSVPAWPLLVQGLTKCLNLAPFLAGQVQVPEEQALHFGSEEDILVALHHTVGSHAAVIVAMERKSVPDSDSDKIDFRD